jgi:hypothetical protein
LFRVAYSVPIWDATEEHVIGVLARSMYLSDLLLDYERSVKSQGADGVGRVLALIDSRDWKLIAHSEWNRSDLKTPLDPDEYERLTISEETVEQLRQLTNPPSAETVTSELDRMTDYIDPMGQIQPEKYGGKWLAAFCRVGETGWLAVVQERRAAAFAAVDELRTRMLLFGLSAVLVVVAIVAGCWWLIVRIVNERPPRWWPWRDAAGSSPLTGPGTLSWTAKGADRA